MYRGGEGKDTEVKSGDRAAVGVYRTHVRVLDLGQVEVQTRGGGYSLTGECFCDVYVFGT